jgi:FtsZ-binding cell division protein ZapB
MVYEDIKDDIGYFVKLYKLTKAKGMDVQQVIDALTIVNNDLPAIKEQFKTLRNDLCTLQSQKHICERSLYQLKNQIATSSIVLNSLRISCIRETREIEDLHNEKAKLESIVTQFKSSNEYLKIKQVAEEKVKDVLTNGKLLLNFATASVIESLRRNPELYTLTVSANSNNTTFTYGSNYLSSMSEQQQQSFDDSSYAAFILEEAEKLYNKLTTKLTNEVMAAAAAIQCELGN